MYNDFLGEIIAEETRVGKRRKPNNNNPVTKNRKRIDRIIESQSRELGKPISEVGLEYVKQNIGDIQRYVSTKGEQPMDNPIDLSVQAFLLRDKEAAQTAKILGCTKDEANVYLDEAEAHASEMNSSDADNFIGSIFGALGNVAQKAAGKIADKRKAAGKKAGFWETLAGGDSSVVTDTAPAESGKNFLEGLKVTAREVLDDIKATEKKKEIKKMLPILVGSIVVLILITVLITKNASKN
ncbi:MAG TPA: hypothetical protein VF487_13195 [Chitinophagaceae bacterium]